MDHGRRQTFFPGGGGQGMWGQISAIEGLLMDAWAITGGGDSWGARPGHGGRCPPARTAHAMHVDNLSSRSSTRAADDHP